jgi:hypothetical protein
MNVQGHPTASLCCFESKVKPGSMRIGKFLKAAAR